MRREWQSRCEKVGEGEGEACRGRKEGRRGLGAEGWTGEMIQMIKGELEHPGLRPQLVDDLLELFEREAVGPNRVSAGYGDRNERNAGETHKTMMVLGESRMKAGVQPLNIQPIPSFLND